MSKRYKNATKQLDSVRAHYEGVCQNFSADELRAMEEEEKAWLRDVLDMQKHKDLPNIYEQKADRGEYVW